MREFNILVLNIILGTPLCSLDLHDNHVNFRNEDFKDPPYESSKLFRIARLTPLKGLSKWEKDILQGFGLLGKVN